MQRDKGVRRSHKSASRRYYLSVMIKLTERLQLVADMTDECECFLDVGTDHAYLPAYLIQCGKAHRAIASDINPNPLRNADKTLDGEKLSNLVELRLSDGFENIRPEDATEIAVAGMGGIMIADMIAKTPWLRDEKYHLVLQPMTHFYDVRRALNDFGFEILREKAVEEGKRVYLVISARWSGKTEPKNEGWYYFGGLVNSKEAADKKYIAKVIASLKKKYNGSHDESAGEALKCIK